MALAAGHSPNTSRQMGRDASNEVARQIDNGLLTEPPVDVDWKSKKSKHTLTESLGMSTKGSENTSLGEEKSWVGWLQVFTR